MEISQGQDYSEASKTLASLIKKIPTKKNNMLMQQFRLVTMCGKPYWNLTKKKLILTKRSILIFSLCKILIFVSGKFSELILIFLKDKKTVFILITIWGHPLKALKFAFFFSPYI